MQGTEPICKKIHNSIRRNIINEIPNTQLHDLIVPHRNATFYNCSLSICEKIQLHSLIQLTNPKLKLNICYETGLQDNYNCDAIRFPYLTNSDKLHFLSKHIKNKTFYIVNCLILTSGLRICQRKNTSDADAKPLEVQNVINPSKDYICEESINGHINCDLNSFIDQLEIPVIVDYALLKTNSTLLPLVHQCEGSQCGFRGTINKYRRYDYEVPGGKIFKCYYANKQQICKELNKKYLYNERYRHRDIY